MLHQLLELLGKRRFTPAHRTEEIEDLLLLFQPLRGVTEVGNDLVYALLHAMEIFEGRITADHLVGEDARQSRVDRCVRSEEHKSELQSLMRTSYAFLRLK